MTALRVGSIDPKQFIDRVAEGKRIRRYRQGEAVFKQREPANHVFYLREGRAKETVSSETGDNAVVGMIEPGMFFGSSSLDDGGYWHSTVTAIVPCSVTEITVDAMRLALQDPLFAQLFMAYLIHHNSTIEVEKAELLFNSSEKRLAKKLLLLAHYGNGPTQKIGPEITQEMLAEMIGTTRPRVNHFLNKFRKLGFIKYNGGIEVLPTLFRMVLQDKPPGRETKE